MSLGYILGGGVGTEPRGKELFDAYPEMRDLYAAISGWTGLSVEILLDGELPEQPEQRQSAGSIRESALACAVHDILVGSGLPPSVLGGLSLGGLTASALAGSVSREDLFGLLVHSAQAPPAGDPVQGMALTIAPVVDDEAKYRGAGRDGIWVAGDFGLAADGSAWIRMLSGEAQALVELGGTLPEGTFAPLPDRNVAIHSPLRRAYRDFMAPAVDALPFAAPRLPLLSCLDPKVLTEADEVRDVFHRNPTDPISLVDVYTGMKDQGVRLGVVIGGSIPDGLLRFPFPAINVDRPEHVTQLLTTAYELGIELSVAGR